MSKFAKINDSLFVDLSKIEAVSIERDVRVDGKSAAEFFRVVAMLSCGQPVTLLESEVESEVREWVEAYFSPQEI